MKEKLTGHQAGLTMVSLRKDTRFTIFLMICIMGFFAIMSSTMSKSPVLPSFASYLQTPAGFWTGLVFSASTIPGILISLPAGSLSDILGRRKMLLTSGMIFASAPFLYLLINSWWQLILVRFYHGFATGIFVPVAQALIAESYPTKRGARISLFSSLTIAGRSAAPVLGGYVLVITNPAVLSSNYSNFQGLYLAVGVAGITALVVALPFLREGKPVGNPRLRGSFSLKSVLQGWLDVAMTPGVFLVSLVEAGQYYTYGSIESFLVKYMGDVARLDASLQGWVLTSELVVVFLSKPLMGWFSDTTGRRIPIIVGCLISAIPLFAVPSFTQFPTLLLLAMVYGLGFSMVTSSTPALVSELVSIEASGSAMGFISTLMDVGQTAGPLVCSMILITSFGYAGLFSSLSIILLLVALVFAHSKIGKTCH
jgi:MFS family permease